MFFNNKKKIELSDNELRIMLYSLNDFRNAILKENKYPDAVDEILPKLKNKMKVDKYDLGVMINSLSERKKILSNENQNTTEIDDLLYKIFKLYETLQNS